MDSSSLSTTQMWVFVHTLLSLYSFVVNLSCRTINPHSSCPKLIVNIKTKRFVETQMVKFEPEVSFVSREMILLCLDHGIKKNQFFPYMQDLQWTHLIFCLIFTFLVFLNFLLILNKSLFTRKTIGFIICNLHKHKTRCIDKKLQDNKCRINLLVPK